MTWLKSCSKHCGSSGKTLYEEYCRADTSAWNASVSALQSDVCPGWKFRRGPTSMSSADIASARHRYLDMYPLTYEEKGSALYVDTLLEIDARQIALRQGTDGPHACAGCRERDREIAILRAALSSPDEPAEAQVDHIMVSSIFRRYFMLDGSSSTSRTEVRETIERVMQREIGCDETLPSTSSVWSAFMRNTLGISGASSGPIRCRLRAHPIDRRDEC